VGESKEIKEINIILSREELAFTVSNKISISKKEVSSVINAFLDIFLKKLKLS